MNNLLFCQFLLIFLAVPISFAEANTSNGSIQEDILQIITKIDQEADSYLQNSIRYDENIINEASDYRQNSQSTILPAAESTSQVKQKKLAQPKIKPKRIIPQQKTSAKLNKSTPANRQSNELNQITNLLNNWANSWSNGNVKTYINFYSKDFSPANNSRKQWEENRTKLINPERKIKITISDVKIKIITKNQVIRSQFKQKFSSNYFTKNSKKQLIWKNINGNWVISSEKTIK